MRRVARSQLQVVGGRRRLAKGDSGRFRWAVGHLGQVADQGRVQERLLRGELAVRDQDVVSRLRNGGVGGGVLLRRVERIGLVAAVDGIQNIVNRAARHGESPRLEVRCDRGAARLEVRPRLQRDRVPVSRDCRLDNRDGIAAAPSAASGDEERCDSHLDGPSSTKTAICSCSPRKACSGLAQLRQVRSERDATPRASDESPDVDPTKRERQGSNPSGDAIGAAFADVYQRAVTVREKRR